MTWQEFEELCLAYLRTAYQESDAVFSRFGGPDSTKADIKVVVPGKDSFFIEAKKQQAQSGQFVVLLAENSFSFSRRNADHDNPYSQQIIDYMNNHRERFEDPGTKGVDIALSQSIMVDWIKRHYQNKSVQFMISSKDNSEFVILPLDKLGDYFEVTAKYRVKRSGSSVPSRNNLDEIQSLLDGTDTELQFTTDRKLVASSDALVDGQRLSGGRYTYQFKQIDTTSQFTVRRLSNTANANVIFSLKLVKDQDADDLALFDRSLV